MRIALVGVENRIHEIESLVKKINFPIDIVPYVYKNYSEIVEVVNSIRQIDGIIFSGYFPYSIAKKSIKGDFPLDYFQFNETCLIKLILSDNFSAPPQSISFDSLTTSNVVQTYSELNFDLGKIYSLSRDKSLTVDKVVSFHSQNFKNNPKLHIITGWFSAHQELIKKGYPSHLLNHTFFSVKHGLNGIINGINFKDSNSSHPSVCIIKIDNIDKVRKAIGNELNVQKMLYKFKSFLLDFQEKLLSFTFESGTDRFSFSTTRKLIEIYTDGYRDFPLIYEIYSRFQFTISVGIGFGLNPMAAYSHAREALALASQDGNTVKILTDTGLVITPTVEKAIIHQQMNFDTATLNISKKSGIGPANITKIKSIMDRQGNHHLTAYELAEALGVTMRSGTRLVSMLLKAGYARESGVIQPPRGRPRIVYQIDFTVD